MVESQPSKDIKASINSLYDQTEQFIAALDSSRPKRLRLITLGLAENICKLWSKHPDPMLAEVLLANNQHSLQAQWLLKCGIMATALAWQLGWSQRAAYGLTIAALLMDISILTELEQLLSNQPLDSEQKRRWRQHSILSAKLAKQHGFNEKLLLLTIIQQQSSPGSKKHHSNIERNKQIEGAALLDIVSRVVLAILPRKATSGLHYQQLLKQLYLTKPQINSRHLRGLIQLFSPVATGALLKDSQAHLYLVLKRPAARNCWAIRIDMPQKDTPLIRRIDQTEDCTELPATHIPNIDQSERWYAGHEELAEHSAAPWPAAQLNASQDLMQLFGEVEQSDTLRTTELVNKITAVPTLCEEVINQANRQTRDAKPITSIKHAVPLLGMDSLLPNLIRGDLLNALGKRRFPCYDWLYHSLQLYTECAAQLAGFTLFLSPEWARTTACFSAASLLLYPPIHTHYLETSTLNSDRSGRFAQLFIRDSKPLLDTAVRLASTWKLPQHIQRTLHYHFAAPGTDEPAKRILHQEHLLRLASFTMLELYTNKPLASDIQAEKSAVIAKIDMKATDYTAAKTAVIESGLLVCPLV